MIGMSFVYGYARPGDGAGDLAFSIVSLIMIAEILSGWARKVFQ
jgi:hypothetical protein